MALSVVFLIVSLAVILLSAELFTNGVEWLGFRLGLNEGVVGSVLAAVGTALPETLIPIVAVFIASEEAHGEEVGIGAILGAPFMLGTLAMFVTGLAITIFAARGQRDRVVNADARVLGRDIRFFIIAYGIAIIVALIPVSAVRYPAAAFAVGLYVYYVYLHATAEGHVGEAEHLHPLRFARSKPDPATGLVLLQIGASLALMLAGARFFVDNVSVLATGLGLPALVLALVIAPVATELPEKFNSVIWVKNGKDTLAMGNITGAMVFQSSFPVSFGMLFTEWHATPENFTGFVSAGIALASVVLIFGIGGLRGRLTAPLLMTGGVWYLAYLLFLVFSGTL